MVSPKVLPRPSLACPGLLDSAVRSSVCAAAQGGRRGNAKAPILREDQLLFKRGRLRKKKAVDESSLDPFNPEFGPDSWCQGQHAGTNKVCMG